MVAMVIISLPLASFAMVQTSWKKRVNDFMKTIEDKQKGEIEKVQFVRIDRKFIDLLSALLSERQNLKNLPAERKELNAAFEILKGLRENLLNKYNDADIDTKNIDINKILDDVEEEANRKIENWKATYLRE